jgi:putative FmdB family regulatory protein
MPTYEYACAACGKKFELFQSMMSEPVAPCPKCGKPSKRQISAGTGIIFKGSGFYLTDYKNKETDKKSASVGSSEANGEKKEIKSESSDSKTEVKETKKESSETSSNQKTEAHQGRNSASITTSSPDKKSPIKKVAPNKAAKPTNKTSSKKRK